jgi:hypothetical protein
MTGAGQGGATGSGGAGTGGGSQGEPWARDMALPWQRNNCKTWTRNPPELWYLPPLPTAEGVWAVGNYPDPNEMFGVGAMMRKGPSGWRMEATPEDAKKRFARLLGDDTILVAFLGAGCPYDVRIRTNGVWADITAPNAPVDATVSTLSGQTLLAHGKNPGEIYKYDGGWSLLPKGSWTAANAIWGSPSDLYVAHSTGLQHFDGTAWKELAPGFPATFDVRGVGGTSAADVYAITRTTVYHIESGVMKPTAGPPAAECNNQTPFYDTILAAGSNLLLLAACGNMAPTWGGIDRIWKRGNGGWTALPALPSFTDEGGFPLEVDSSRVRLMPDGTLTLGSVDLSGNMHVLSGNAWVPYPIETPAPVDSVEMVVGGKELYAVGRGLSKLVGNAWQPVAGAPSSLAKSNWPKAWQAPDGTLFLVVDVYGGPNQPYKHELWRSFGNGFTLDKTVSALGPTGLRGRSSSDVLFVYAGGSLRWDGSSWNAMPLPAPPFDVLQDFAYAGTSWIVAQSGQHLLEYDGSTWTDMGATEGVCCDQVGPIASPSVFVNMVDGNFAVRDQNGWSIRKTTLPRDLLGRVLGVHVAGPAPDKLFGRHVGSIGVATDSGFGPLGADGTWVLDLGWPFLYINHGDWGQMWADEHIAAMPVRFGGGDLQGAIYNAGGDAVTVCDVGP